MYDFSLTYAKYQQQFETYANAYFDNQSTNPPHLLESMKYSFLNGGKRIRPVIMLAVADVLGVNADDVLPFALALEMVHTYSLIHDDLPCMDNDDFRRGKPSNHKVYGEGNAVLAGDGLLNTAYSLCFTECLKGKNQIAASALLCDLAGVEGMIAGQSLDLYAENNPEMQTEENLLTICELKTGKLLTAASAIPAVLNGGTFYLQLRQFGLTIGTLFQMTDDILDVTGDFESLGKTIGKDEKEQKLTSIRFYGLNGVKMNADLCASRACAFLDAVDGDVTFLRDLVSFIRNRKH